MKLPIPLLLYVVALGLFGLAGWTVYETLPLWKKEVREAATSRGAKDGTDLITKGRGQKGPLTNWRYTPESAPWWAGFKTVNLIGKLPPPPLEQKQGPSEAEKPVEADVRPLSDLIELVSLVYDGSSGGKGGNSHVIVRYKTEANVEPPEYWVRENTAPPAGSTPSTAPSQPRDVAPGRGAQRPPATQPPTARPAMTPVRGATPMPTSVTGRDILQKIWVQDDGDHRRSAQLWPMKPASTDPGKPPGVLGVIRLVRVAADAQSAFFSREVPSPEAGKPPIVREDELLKAAMDLSQDVLHELRRLQGAGAVRPDAKTAGAQPMVMSWLDVQETTVVGKVRHIGRKDEKRFRESDDFLERLNVDTYVSKSGRRGLIVRSADAELASSFGVAPGDVLLELNGQKVESKAQAFSLGKEQYKRGVRTFVSKWLSGGQEVERIYQAPDK